MEKIGLKIKEARKNKKITQTELADKIGVSKHTIAKYEQSQRIPNLETITKIVDILEIDFWEVMPNLNVELEPVDRNEEDLKFGELVQKKVEIKKILSEWAGKNYYSRDLNNLFRNIDGYEIGRKLEEVEFNEYIRRLNMHGQDSDKSYINTEKFRKDISKEIKKALEFTIELKLMEAIEKIKEY